jgi:hypothetical protein
MADDSHSPASERPPAGDPPAAGGTRALLVTLLIVVAGAAVGLAGGYAWSALAPQAVFSVSSPGVAFVVNPETTAFIAADGWFSLVAVAGGIVIGVLGYLVGVRRHGPLPVAGVLAGATVAAFLAAWTGRNIGLAAFRHRLLTDRSGDLISQPVSLGAHGALAFWPMAAAATVGVIELILALRDRRRRLAASPAAAGPPREARPYGAPYQGSRGADRQPPA